MSVPGWSGGVCDLPILLQPMFAGKASCIVVKKVKCILCASYSSADGCVLFKTSSNND